MSGNQFQRLPKLVSALLEVLIAKNNLFVTIDFASLKDCKNLRSTTVRFFFFFEKKINATTKKNKQTKKFESNVLKEVSGLNWLTRLHTAKFSKNKSLSTIGDIGELQQLCAILLDNCNFETAPSGLERLVSLRELDMSANRLTMAPSVRAMSLLATLKVFITIIITIHVFTFQQQTVG